MIRYGQFCPVAKTAEIFGDRWSPRFCCNDIGSRCTGGGGRALARLTALCGAVEQVGDDDGLGLDIMTVNLSKLSLPHHRHRF